MAKKKKTAAPIETTERASPLLGNALLWIGFLVVLAIGVVTVFVPELADDGSDEDGGSELAEGEAEEPTEGDTAPSAAGAAAGPSSPGP